MTRFFVTAGLVFGVGGAPLNATVISGVVTGGSTLASGGAFNLAVPGPGYMVGRDKQQSFDLFAFDEKQAVTLLSSLTLDLGGTILAGTTISSHYVFFDPKPLRTVRATVTFDGPVLGAMTTRAGGLFTDAVFGKAGVTYLSPPARGLERGDLASFFGNRLSIRWSASSPGDYVRVFTLAPAPIIPEPTSWAMMLTGFAVAGFAVRRERQKQRITSIS